MSNAVGAAGRIAKAWGASAMTWTARSAFAMVAICSTAAYAQLAVSDSGTPTYSQPIAVPPGVAGMSPKIGLFYAGGGVNGPVGYGWSIQGISAITRCPAIKAIDGIKGSVTFTASDKLCLDGQRLIQVDPTTGVVVNGGVQSPSPANPFQTNDSLGLASTATPREYRTEKDSYARIRAYGYANGDATGTSGPGYFKVWTKSGQIYEYGASPSADANTKALISPYQKTAAAVWALARISDTLGNFIDFKYEQRDVAWGTGGTALAPQSGHEWNLLEIQYGGNKVVFNYVDRPDNAVGAMQDRAEAWHLGSKNVSVRRLQSITTYVNSPNPAVLGSAAGAVPVKTTQIVYSNGSVSGRSRVTFIKECAGDATSTKCLPATTFNYANGGSEAYQANSNFANSTLATLPMISTSGTYSVLTGDFDGDGKTDILRLGTTPADNQLWLSRGDGTFNQVPGGAGAGQFNLTTQKLFSSDGCYAAVVADFTGDGIADVLRTIQTTSNSGASCPADTNLLFVGNGDGSFKAPAALPASMDLSSVKEIYTSTPSSCILASLPIRDGDLLAMADMQVALTSGGTCYNQRKSIGKAFYVLDVNGDGILDVISTVNPAYYANYQTGDPIPTPDQSCAAPAICTHVYLGSAVGAFAELTSTNLTNHSVYADPPAGGAYAAIFKANTVDVDGDGLADLSVGKNGVWRSNGDGNFTPLAGYGSTCVRPIDFNGDGRADCLIVSALGASYNSLSTSNGGLASVATPRFNLTQTGQELTTPSTSALALESVVLDINGDGRGDILRWSDDTTKNTVYLSNGDGSFTESTSFNLKDLSVSTAENQLKKSDGSFDFVVGDFTGHGTPEILRMAAAHTAPAGTSNRLFTKVDFRPADQLVSVIGGTGAITTLYYAPLTNPTPLAGSADSSARYTSDRNTPDAAISPTLDVNFPMYVVTTSVSDNGMGAGIATEYSYRGLKTDLTGRGFLGFREVRRQSPGPDPAGSALTVSTQYLQSHPYIGVPARSDTRLGTVNNTSAQLLSSSVNAYCDITSPAGSDAAALTNAQNNVPNVFCPNTAKVQRPYLLWAKETGTDLGGATLPAVTTRNTFQASGDPSQIIVTTVGNVAGTSQTFTKTTTNQYLADNIAGDNWVLGRLSSASVQSSVPNVLASLTTSAGTAPNASATKGTAPLPPLTAAQLMPILQLLLLDD